MEGVQAQMLASTPPHPSAALDSLLGIDTQVCESRLTWTVVGEWGIWRNAAGVFRSRFNRLESTIDYGGNQIAGVQHDLPYGRADCPATPGIPCAPNQIRTGVPSLKIRFSISESANASWNQRLGGDISRLFAGA
jgi:hypothetical protein